MAIGRQGDVEASQPRSVLYVCCVQFRNRPADGSASLSIMVMLRTFGDPIIATSILDRLLHHSTTVNIREESYRLKDRRKAGLSP